MGRYAVERERVLFIGTQEGESVVYWYSIQ